MFNCVNETTEGEEEVLLLMIPNGCMGVVAVNAVVVDTHSWERAAIQSKLFLVIIIFIIVMIVVGD